MTPPPPAAAQGNVAPAAVEEQAKEEEEEFDDLAGVLQHLGLSEYKGTFDEEKIDIESFVRLKVVIQ